MNEQAIRDWLTDGGIWVSYIIVAAVLAWMLRFVISKFLDRMIRIASRTSTHTDDLFIAVAGQTKSWVLFFWILFLLINTHPLSNVIEKPARALILLVTLAQVGFWGKAAIQSWNTEFLQRRAQEDASSAAAMGLLYISVQALFFVTLFLVGLSNFGVDIAALLAGLGVGGIAVALAAQNILGDLLASLSIVLDKPFVVGDFIIVGSDLGTVEHVGLKTTRVRALSGEQLIFSNKDLLESRVRNFKRMWQRRVVQGFRVTYDTPPEKIAQVPGWVRGMIEADPLLTFDRCHFMRYGASSLDFEMVFWVKNPEYNVFMDRQQELLLNIMRKLQAEGIEFAFPTQTLHLNGGLALSRDRSRETKEVYAPGVEDSAPN